MIHVVDQIPLGGIVTVRDRLLEMQANGHQIMRLESGDPSFDIPPHVREAIEKALRDGLTHYTAGAGIPPLRQAIADKLQRENHILVEGPHRVLVTNGAMHGLYVTFRALIEEPGDEIIIPDPTWTETADNVRLAGGTVVHCPLDENCHMRPHLIESLVTPRTKAIVINSPHNPTGGVCDLNTLQHIRDIAEKHNLWVVSDEAYEHVIFDGHRHVSIGSLAGMGKRTVSIFSMSKSYAMSGLRVGYLCVNDDVLMERMSKLARCTINGVNSATQHGAVAALNGPQECTQLMRKEYQYRRDVLLGALEQLTCLKPFKPAGAFYIWVRIKYPLRTGHDGWALTNFLIDEARIGSAPGEVFGPAGTGYIRFAFSCPTEQVEQAAGILPTLGL